MTDSLWDFLSQYRTLTALERIDIWLDSYRVRLGMDLTTYYLICCSTGFLQGYGLGKIWVAML